MRKFSLGLVSGLLVGLLLSGSIAFAGSPIKLIVNGRQVACDSPPQIINGRVMVPARNVAESLGATVSWDAANQSVIITSKVTASTDNPEKAEFLKISAEADALIAKYEGKLEGSISESESKAMTAEVKAFLNKLAGWGELYPYSTMKSLYADCLTNLGIAYISKSTYTSEYGSGKFKSQYDSAYSLFQIDKNKINAEKSRLTKLGYL